MTKRQNDPRETTATALRILADLVETDADMTGNASTLLFLEALRVKHGTQPGGQDLVDLAQYLEDLARPLMRCGFRMLQEYADGLARPPVTYAKHEIEEVPTCITCGLSPQTQGHSPACIFGQNSPMAESVKLAPISPPAEPEPFPSVSVTAWRSIYGGKILPDATVVRTFTGHGPVAAQVRKENERWIWSVYTPADAEDVASFSGETETRPEGVRLASGKLCDLGLCLDAPSSDEECEAGVLENEDTPNDPRILEQQKDLALSCGFGEWACRGTTTCQEIRWNTEAHIRNGNVAARVEIDPVSGRPSFACWLPNVHEPFIAGATNSYEKSPGDQLALLRESALTWLRSLGAYSTTKEPKPSEPAPSAIPTVARVAPDASKTGSAH